MYRTQTKVTVLTKQFVFPATGTEILGKKEAEGG